jgi:molybdenum cofactor synthesis domain-containing protein
VDAIVMVEDSEPAGDAAVRLLRPVAVGDAVRAAGSDVRAGEVVLTPGTVLRPAHLGVLASIGRLTVRAHRRPLVGVLSTGDELVNDGGPLALGQIRESNKHMLLALVAAAGAEPVDLGLVRDDESALEAVLADGAARCDALVTSGGVSMGDFDIVKAVLSRLAEMRWMQIAIKPAKPFAFGVLPTADGRRVPVIGLPGNPVSSFVSFELLARPALRRLAGHADPERPPVLAIADAGMARRPDGKTHWVRVYGGFGPDGRLHVQSTGPQGSHQLAATAAAQGLAEVVDGDGVAAGGEVPVLWFD